MEDNPIKQYRDDTGLTQEQVGDMAGVKKAVVSKWESGVSPSIESAKRLDEASKGKLPKWKLRPDVWDEPKIEPDTSAPSEQPASA